MVEAIPDIEVESFVFNLIYQVNGVEPQDIQLQDSLINDLLMDSVELIDLLMRLEGFGIIIPESGISERLLVSDIVKCVSDGK